MTVPAATPPRPPLARSLLGWIDSNEFPWTAPLPPWYPTRTRALRRLRILARSRIREQLVTGQGWPRTLTQAFSWPAISAVKALRSFHYHPLPACSGVCTRTKETLRRWWIQFVHNLRISDQKDLFLYLPANRSRATSFITCRENQALIFLSNQPVNELLGIRYKNTFARFCAEHRLPTAAALLTGCGSVIESALPLPAADLFLKLANGAKGIGAEIIPRSPVAAGWLGAHGEFIPGSSLPHYAARRLGAEPWIFQERLQNNPSWSGFTPGALATVRIVTGRAQPSGQPECLAAFLRCPRRHAMVDNLSAGGLAASIDLATGELGPGRDWIDSLSHYDRHPDTGSPLTGVILPGWSDLLALALRAHHHAGNIVSVGWDVTLAIHGSVVIEAIAWTIPPFTPPADTRYIEIMNSCFFPDR